MKSSTLIFFFAAILAAGKGRAAAEAGQPGGFLRAGSGARALALGNAYVAVASGPETALWNSAGLGLMDRVAFASSVSALSLGRQFADLSLGIPLGARGRGWGNWALSWLRFSLGDDFEGRQSDTASFYHFSDEQSAYELTHGRMITDWLAVGAGLKGIQHRIDVYDASGFGADLGLLILPHPKFHIGVSVTDLFSRLSWSTGTAEKIPYTLRLGMSALVLADWLLLSAQATGVEGRQASYQAGLELRFKGLFFARAGLNEQSFTLGGGASVPVYQTRVSFDYAFAPDPLGLGSTQRFSLGMRF
jgi:hypothetical protein